MPGDRIARACAAVSRAESGSAPLESGELDKAVIKGEGKRGVLRAPSPLLAQEDPHQSQKGRENIPVAGTNHRKGENIPVAGTNHRREERISIPYLSRRGRRRRWIPRRPPSGWCGARAPRSPPFVTSPCAASTAPSPTRCCCWTRDSRWSSCSFWTGGTAPLKEGGCGAPGGWDSGPPRMQSTPPACLGGWRRAAGPLTDPLTDPLADPLWCWA
eukprot:5110330-Pyramimonas_sp.AAC.1